MSSLRIRPRFNEIVVGTTADYLAGIKKAFDENKEFTGLVSDQYCVINICREERHYWSPQLTLTLEELPDGNLKVRGLYGPKPSVWAIFFMSYAALGVLSMFAAVFGFSQVILEKPAPILWALPVIGAIALCLYLIAQAGQKFGAEQMFRIHHFYEQVIKHRVTID